ncbi:MAG TPA: DUF192 domain-containing protein [Rhodocyclaceae bacterium]
MLFVGERCVLPRVWRAESAWERARGLLGRPPLAAGEGLWIEPCGSVHTFGMGYPIDLAFVGGDARLRKLVRALPPLRLAGCAGARATLETAAGQLAQAGLGDGDYLTWREARA